LPYIGWKSSLIRFIPIAHCSLLIDKLGFIHYNPCCVISTSLLNWLVEAYMLNRQIGAFEAKTHFSQLISEVERGEGKSRVICRKTSNSLFSISISGSPCLPAITGAGTSTKHGFSSASVLVHFANVCGLSPFAFAYAHAFCPLCRQSSSHIAFFLRCASSCPPKNNIFGSLYRFLAARQMRLI